MRHSADRQNGAMRSIITAHELWGALSGPRPPVVIDVRWALGGPPGHDVYLRGHLPGAVYVDLDSELAGPPGHGGRHPLPDVEVATAALRRAGVDEETRVVVYDDRTGLAAARAWWVFRDLGVGQVHLLDGGYAIWRAAGFPVTVEQPNVRDGTFRPRPGSMRRVDADGAARLAADGVLLDARAVERFRGEVEPIDPVAGHIPGATSAPTDANLTPDGTFADEHALRRRFAELGVRPGADVGVYCGSGVTATHQVLALDRIGVDAALYAGSWSEWVGLPGRPVATGD